jgi:hypothetical protein
MSRRGRGRKSAGYEETVPSPLKKKASGSRTVERTLKKRRPRILWALHNLPNRASILMFAPYPPIQRGGNNVFDPAIVRSVARHWVMWVGGNRLEAH